MFDPSRLTWQKLHYLCYLCVAVSTALHKPVSLGRLVLELLKIKRLQAFLHRGDEVTYKRFTAYPWELKIPDCTTRFAV